jgi:hypothetical protein
MALALLSACGQSDESSMGEQCDKPGELWTINQDQIAICIGGEGGNRVYAEGAIFDEVLLIGNLSLFIPGGDKEISQDALNTFKESLGIEIYEGNDLDISLLRRVISRDARWDQIREALAVVELSEEEVTGVYRQWCPDFSEEEPYCLPKLMGEQGLNEFFQADEDLDNAISALYPKLKVLDSELKSKYLVEDIISPVEVYLTLFAEKEGLKL